MSAQTNGTVESGNEKQKIIHTGKKQTKRHGPRTEKQKLYEQQKH